MSLKPGCTPELMERAFAEATRPQQKSQTGVHMPSATEKSALSAIHRERAAAEQQAHLRSNESDLGLSNFEIRNYSYTRGLRNMAARAEGDATRLQPTDVARSLSMARFGFADREHQPDRPSPVTCLEDEVSRHLASKYGPPAHGGMLMPWSLNATSGQDTSTDATGKFTIGKSVGELIDALAVQTLVIQFGASVAQDLQGAATVPREDAVMAASWVSENGSVDVSESDTTYSQLALNPKLLSSTTSFSKKLLETSSLGIENVVRSRMVRGHGIAIDAAALNGPGSGNQPLGLLNTPNLPIVALGVNGGNATSASIHQLVRTVAAANADHAGNAFITTAIQREKLSQLARFTGASIAVWASDADVVGHRGGVSNSVPANLTKGTASPPTLVSAIIYGNWADLQIGFWGPIEIVIDGYTLKKRNMYECTSYACVDIGIRNIGSFCAIVDAL